ncbi:MAG: sterol desaturase family protein [Thermodesulfobacteriota bacterium]|nr:sterol desaturase family protein [Thermodesulfobacteriota bacterium]
MLNENLYRIGAAIIVLLIMAGWETVAPKRKLTTGKTRRWTTNLTIIGLDNLLVIFLIPVTVIQVSLAAQASKWGLFNQLDLPPVLTVLLSVLVLDLVIYLQHLMFHAVPLFWRLHMVHHADLDIDVTTGLRFHPVEIILSVFIKIATVAALGPPILAVLIFEILLNATAMFNHGNVALPTNIDRWLRLMVVTPDMHRVHHSVIIRETNSNFGFNFPWWDRLFGTYRPQPVQGHQKMTIGLSQYRNAADLGLGKVLLLPVTGNPGSYSLSNQGREPKQRK